MNIKNLAVIGAGNMGRAIIFGLISSKKLSPDEICACDKNDGCLDILYKHGVRVFERPIDCIKNADAIILAVKPNSLEGLSLELEGMIKTGVILISICAGKTISTLEDFFGRDKKIARVMPNTPATVGEGMSGISGNKNLSNDELFEVKEIFESFGKAEIVKEELLDTVTGISGSGPAYAFMFIDALKKAGAKNGMSEEQSKVFAAQTVLGAAKMVLETDVSPEQLKINVCSPGGTTIEAVKVFEQRKLYDIVDEAVSACIKKSKDMAK